MLEIAVIIVSWNVKKYLSACLNSLNAELEQSNIKGTVWVIDNASTDGSPEMVTEQFPDVKLVANKDNLGFGRANNQGMRLATQKKDPAYFFLLNPDTVVQPKSIRHLIDFMEKNPRAGMSGPRLVFGSGRFQHSAFHFPGLAQLFFDLFPLPGRFYETAFNGRYPRAQAALNAPPFPIDHPLGAAMMVRRSVAEATRGFNEAYHMYCEEVDWCWRIRKAGWKIYTVPTSEIIHFGGESTKQIPAISILNLWESRARLYRHHRSGLPFWSARLIVWAGLTFQGFRAEHKEIRAAYFKARRYW